MRRLLLVSVFLMAGAGAAFAQSPVEPLAIVVSTCGTPPSGYTAGKILPITQDTTGTLCTPSGGSGGSAVTTSPAATTPAVATASAIVTGGTAVTLVTGPVKGCYILNPLSAADQNIATAEVAQVNPYTTATATGRGGNSTLQPGQGWNCIPGQTTNVSAIAATTAHAFNVVVW